MIKGSKKIREELNLETILNKIDDYSIFRYYLGQDFDFKKKFKSPFRHDKTPNLTFFMGNNEKIIFKDFSNGYGGDCVEFVKKLFGLNFNEALLKIDQDFGLGIASVPGKFKINITRRPDSIPKEQKLIQIVQKDFTSEDLDYWGSYQITKEELENKNVFSIEKLYINKQLIQNYNKELRFAYLFDDYLKIYTPHSNHFKWISNCPNDYISGLDDIKWKNFNRTNDKKLIISKSVKDEIILKKFFKDVCSTQNESSASITELNIKMFQHYYEDVYLTYDADKAGIEAAMYYQKCGFKTFTTPEYMLDFDGIKDWADLVKKKGLKTMEAILKHYKLI